jgi:hypothetical protein
MIHQNRRGQFTPSKHAAMNETGLMQSAPSTIWISASTTTGQTGSGSEVMIKLS